MVSVCANVSGFHFSLSLKHGDSSLFNCLIDEFKDMFFYVLSNLCFQKEG